ncbi:MAG: glutaredoxin family protein [Lautropia sp.]|nr:glutaredoxin family protein [Lautropia sp.]
MKALTATTSLLLATASMLIAPSAGAAEYRWTDESGRIVYGDQPPEGAVALRMGGARTTEVSARPAADPTADFPMGLRDAARSYPVEVFVANDCAPCQQAVQMLRKRGIPFQEWLVQTHDDFARFKEKGFTENGFPAISVGGQRSIGFEVNAWERMLDKANYPKVSVLPDSYRYPIATNLSPTTPIIGATTLGRAEAPAPMYQQQPRRREVYSGAGQAAPQDENALRF